MVGKLFKYEFLSFMRAVLPYQILMPSAALLLRIVQIFESDTAAYNTVFISSLVMFIISIAVALVMTFATAITRYYKNLFTYEGYLSFTLPVTESAHIFAKLSVSVLWIIISAFVIIASISIATMGEVFVEICKAVAYMTEYLFTHGKWDFVFFIIEFVILAICLVSTALLLFYGCVTVGQLAKKNRILAAFGAYFGYYVITQILGTIFIAIYATSEAFRDFLSRIVDLLSEYPIDALHIFMWIGIVFAALLGTLYFTISHRIMSRRLNLE